MKTTTLSLALIAALSMVAGPAAAEIGTMDQVPAATLLLPYFEVSLDEPASGQPSNTTFTIGNASATAVVAHVTLWTDLGVPTYTFDVYLTGYDVEIINLRLLFHGILPVTADSASDPGDTSSPTDGISSQGQYSQDINWPGSTGPCTSSTLYQRLPGADVTALRNAHTGQGSALLGGNCGATDHNDNVARGFITVDVVTSCNLVLPTDEFYATYLWAGNVLFGEYWVIDSANNYSHAEPLVAIEASESDPRTNGAGDYTFYGRLNGGSGADHREGLPTTWMGRYVNGGTLDGGTTAFVWRDAWPRSSFVCGSAVADLSQAYLTGFDEQENPDFLPLADYFPLAAEAVSLANPSRFPLESGFGFLYYDLRLGAPAGTFGTTNQSYVTHAFSATGRFAGAFAVWPLDNVEAPLVLSGPFALPACMNGIDDDGDGDGIDFPNDPGCQNADSETESPQCDDDDDNDNDGFVDYPDDLQCTAAWDNREYN